MNDTQFKNEVLNAFQKVSPSKINIEDGELLKKYISNHYNLFFHKLKFPPLLFQNKKIVDFGCGTGEVDIVLAKWGAVVEGFDFNEKSIERAILLQKHFNLPDQIKFSMGDVDTFPIEPGDYDFSVSMGVIAHVPDQENMFRRMAEACKSGGFVILGFIEDAGLIQRLLHRAIVLVNSDRSDAEIFKIAQSCFAEHIERSVTYGGRSAQSVINDYLVNPHYIGISTNTLLSWAKKYGLEHYSAWPNIELPFVVDSPYFNLISKASPIYRQYLSLQRLRWLYAQDEDANVFGELIDNLPKLDGPVEKMFLDLNNILQSRDYREDTFSCLKNDIVNVENAVDQTLNTVSNFIQGHLKELNNELIRILDMIIRKARENEDFDLNTIGNKLFRGYNGLGTSYVIFHKLDEN
jgi:2-polyprenyl-3-methyl-5-hydroxy-6-metoxy-1,4-benzoquinol methylase